ncbi:hypothetical protein BS78_K342300 [Paspalum vaginatum]|uniref:Uncharacterized protein n=1 Tax=Paspalum vaginatum TaxID=158149 RepID=A0A9W7XDL6_9POAL|nr:hypothetical protein BS78_K342300 [Paspalum vaginatum]
MDPLICHADFMDLGWLLAIFFVEALSRKLLRSPCFSVAMCFLSVDILASCSSVTLGLPATTSTLRRRISTASSVRRRQASSQVDAPASTSFSEAFPPDPKCMCHLWRSPPTVLISPEFMPEDMAASSWSFDTCVCVRPVLDACVRAWPLFLWGFFVIHPSSGASL